jgi:formylglycine-generating enzyme required for sulfatase activity
MYASCPQHYDEVGRGNLTPEEEREVLEKLPPFDPATARSQRDNGALVELFRSWPGSIVNAHVARFVAETGHAVDDPALAARLQAEQLADHPATGLTYDEAAAFCAWAGGRLPAGDEWEAAARGTDARPWPWGAAFDADRCASAETPYGFTEAVTAHPDGASPIGAEQMAGNVWEWVADPPDEDGWRRLRGGSYLDHAWGVRAARSLPADPARPTATTGFRIAADPDTDPRRRQR